MNKEWVYKNLTDEEKALILQLHEKTLYPLPILEILLKLGLKTAEDIDRFMTPTLDKMYPPELLPQIKEGGNRLHKAIENNEKILIYGDFDADGVIATAILFSGLRKIGADVDWEIPDRFKDGYGLNIQAIDRAKDRDVSLIITVDTGITAINEVKYANKLNIDVIITDHHTPSDTLPEALAIINPKLKDSSYPFKELCGSAVAFKFLQYMEETYHYDIDYLSYIGMVSIATISDIMPLIDENRIIVKYGIEQLNENAPIGISELKIVSGIKKNITESNIAYQLAPRLNAAGRMGTSHTAFYLLTSENTGEARAQARTLESKNRERQRISQQIYREAVEQIESSDIKNDPVIVVHSSQWHEGVIGIVASKLSSKYNKPAIVIAMKEGIGKGSARSNNDYDIFSIIEQRKDLMLAFGGHTMAAGFSIKESHLSEFKQFLKEEIKSNAEQTQLKSIFIDSYIDESDIKWHLYRLIEQLKPFGFGNRKPIFAWKNAPIKGYPRIYKEKHLSFNVGTSGINVIGFNMAHLESVIMESISSGHPYVDIAFYIDKNEMFNSFNSIQLKLIDLKPSEKI